MRVQIELAIGREDTGLRSAHRRSRIFRVRLRVSIAGNTRHVHVLLEPRIQAAGCAPVGLLGL
jgi:hypothetical protein